MLAELGNCAFPLSEDSWLAKHQVLGDYHNIPIVAFHQHIERSYRNYIQGLKDSMLFPEEFSINLRI
jgi:hypothetical protein